MKSSNAFGTLSTSTQSRMWLLCGALRPGNKRGQMDKKTQLGKGKRGDVRVETGGVRSSVTLNEGAFIAGWLNVGLQLFG